jgi:hypothetical protein
MRGVYLGGYLGIACWGGVSFVILGYIPSFWVKVRHSRVCGNLLEVPAFAGMTGNLLEAPAFAGVTLLRWGVR